MYVMCSELYFVSRQSKYLFSNSCLFIDYAFLNFCQRHFIAVLAVLRVTEIPVLAQNDLPDMPRAAVQTCRPPKNTQVGWACELLPLVTATAENE